MQEKRTELSVSTEVIEKMTELATNEIAGVKSIAKKSIDIRDTVKNKGLFKGVKVESINGALEISVYICVAKDAHVCDTAEAVQTNVKEKIQSMTGAAVTRVNVIVADVEGIDDEAAN